MKVDMLYMPKLLVTLKLYFLNKEKASQTVSMVKWLTIGYNNRRYYNNRSYGITKIPLLKNYH